MELFSYVANLLFMAVLLLFEYIVIIELIVSAIAWLWIKCNVIEELSFSSNPYVKTASSNERVNTNSFYDLQRLLPSFYFYQIQCAKTFCCFSGGEWL